MQERWVALDLETSAGDTDLKTAGLGRYAADSKIHIAAWRFGYANVPSGYDRRKTAEQQEPRLPTGQLVYPLGAESALGEAACDAHIGNLLADTSLKIVAHNAEFERAVLLNWARKKCSSLVETLNPERFICTMVLAQKYNLPAGLDDLSHTLLGRGKLAEGYRLLKCWIDTCAAGGDPEGDKELLGSLLRYCERDTDLAAACLRVLNISNWEPALQRGWCAHVRANERGLPIDTDRVAAARYALENDYRRVEQKFAELTGDLRPTERAKFRRWLGEATGGDMPETMETDPLTNWAASKDAGIQEVVSLYSLANQVAPKKWIRAADLHTDGRIKYSYLYLHTQTGRWTSKDLQLQNFKRSAQGAEWELPDPDATLGAAIGVLGDSVRSMICAPAGKKLYISDYSQIELRLLLWFAGETHELAKLDAGVDIYVEFAERLFGNRTNPVSKEQRTIAKTAVLGLGYGMGISKFAANITPYCAPGKAEQIAKDAHRVYYDLFGGVKYLRDQLASVWLADKHSEGKYSVRTAIMGLGRVFYLRLPTGRDIVYPAAAEKNGDKTFLGGGRLRYANPNTLVENLVSGTARDIMDFAMVDLDASGLEIVGHTHDEIVAVVPSDFDPYTADGIMTSVLAKRDIMRDVPLACESRVAERWG